ncbi:hypothetical protein [Rhizobium chutanense]|uniref:hypothetical protein n=1 Tax=Rhizobium chutanense TaxID=2035448 RepID=UPI0013E09716|nr:hypothetical protein [Rhizobium chutanense]
MTLPLRKERIPLEIAGALWQNTCLEQFQEKCEAVFPGKAQSAFAGNCVKTKS